MFLSLGMPYDLYWYGDLDAVDSYEAKFNFELKQKQVNMDTLAWLEGTYVRIAVASALSDKVKYPTSPLAINSVVNDNDESVESDTDRMVRKWDTLKGILQHD